MKYAELNTGQQEAYEKIIDFILDRDSSSLFLLEGFAGTGKTFLVSRIIKEILKKKHYWKIAITAPTNKAVKVLYRSANIRDPRVAYKTIHKLLGLSEEITEEGVQTFAVKKTDFNEIEKYSLLIVDEVSMLSDVIFREIETHRGRIKIIFMGDPAQIPPVKEVDSIPLQKTMQEKYGIERHLLTEIMRQKEGNPILEIAGRVRNSLTVLNPIIHNQNNIIEGKGVIFINTKIQEERDKIVPLLKEYFSDPLFDRDPDYVKVIAWRNTTIAHMNGIIRQELYGKEISKIVMGEKLIAQNPIMEGKEIIFTTNDEFTVRDYSIDKDSSFSFYPLKFYSAEVEYKDIENKIHTEKIKILHEEATENFNRILLILKNKALSKKGEERREAWISYYNFLRRFADINYNYAISCHKSQGSTYQNVFILEDDINKNYNLIERNRIKYTVFSRPTDKLYILKKF